MIKILILLFILIIIFIISKYNSEQFLQLDNNYESITTSTIGKNINNYNERGYINPTDGYMYANNIANNLQN
jgi:hypothetical protein